MVELVTLQGTVEDRPILTIENGRDVLRFEVRDAATGAVDLVELAGEGASNAALVLRPGHPIVAVVVPSREPNGAARAVAFGLDLMQVPVRVLEQ
ncbi:MULTISPECIES: hypothetical protein [Pimelobacter]|uniref:hypothetical protein n=1 Tax=Pimelobacter TaxID=2044 RepID=UPI001C03CA5F|nr:MULTISPECIES: hypothetical protein [Pimelobacter]MBU2698822.1 hypothetical protein [Pimelobacter sp. 30-1]UUW93012.1 hypothetical protein M0M43_30730 [Pimelobacter simplex]UUW99045.1 hypothetical protein M0M48_30750 [Pimelobacter simplex]